MKKYLFNGAMALIVGAFIVSCSHDDIGQISTVDEMTKSFDEMFKELYGPIAPNHNWGFNTVVAEEGEDETAEEQAATRGIIGTRAFCDKDAHMWADKGYDVPVELSEAQKRRVISYFQHNKLQAGGSQNWTSFFMQQVYKGGTSPLGNKDTPNGYSAEVYHCANGNWVTGGSQIDYLTTNSTDHVYDFNAGDVSEIGNVQNSPNVQYLNDNGNGTHKDKIRLMTGSLATNFGYHNSNAEITYTDKYTLVDGSVIDTWATTSGNNVGASVSGRYFVGFDWEQYYKEEEVFTGSWTFKGKEYKYVINAPNKYCGWIESFNDDTKPTAKGDDEIQKWLTKGYLPVSGNDKQWAKVERCADGYFTDWIISIAPAYGNSSTPEKTPAKEESKTITTNTYRKIVDLGRVFCEDIATARMNVVEDVDYNDIVFDARVWEIYDQKTTTYNGSTTTSDKRNIKYQYDISMLAAGGTIPENVGINNVDVHDAFGVGLTFMVNTWTDKSTAFGQYNTPTNVMQPKQEVISYTLDYNDSRLDKSNVGISSIPIYVKYNGQNVKALDNKNTDAPYKLCVPIGILWPIERVNIQNAYTNFRDFVSSPSNKFYEDKGSQVSANLYTQAPTSRIQSDGWNIGYTQLVSSSSSTSKIYVVWEGDVTENNTAITLYDFNFQSGQTLRFYGSGTITVNCGASGETGLISNGSMTNGYIDVYLYPYQASQLSQGILVQGSNFRLTKIVVL
jgi:hypothetical protein